VYEELITVRFEQKMKEFASLGWHPVSDTVGDESAPHVLARHIARTVRRVLQSIPAEERVYATNHILESVSTLEGAQEWVELVADGPRQLLALARQEVFNETGVAMDAEVRHLGPHGLLRPAHEAAEAVTPERDEEKADGRRIASA
jgi:hypothetical protein